MSTGSVAAINRGSTTTHMLLLGMAVAGRSRATITS